MRLCANKIPYYFAVVFAMLLHNKCYAYEYSVENKTRTFYIDYDEGSDYLSGKSPQNAWKHSPGDKSAKGVPSTFRLKPGDKLIFRGGVAYKGSIDINADGVEGNLIQYVGNQWGSSKAIIDGSEKLITESVNICNSESSVCRKARYREYSIYRILLNKNISSDEKLYLSGLDRLTLSRVPDLVETSFEKDISTYFNIKDGDGSIVTRDGLLRDVRNRKYWPQSDCNQCKVSFWHQPNEVLTLHINDYNYNNGLIKYPPESNIKLYEDQDNKYSILNHPGGISIEGEYAVSGNEILVYMNEKTKLSGLSRSHLNTGFDLNGSSYISIIGFEIVNQKMSAISIKKQGSTGVDISELDIHDLGQSDKSIAIDVYRAKNLNVNKSKLYALKNASSIGVRESEAIIIDNVEINNVGNTAIRLYGNRNVVVSGARINRLYSLHGNGISIYLNNRDIKIINSVIDDVFRPITFHGDDILGSGPIEISNNIIQGVSMFNNHVYSHYSVSGWGRKMNGVLIFNNIILMDGNGVGLFVGRDIDNVSITDNIIDGVILHDFGSNSRQNIKYVGNIYTKLSWQQKKDGASNYKYVDLDHIYPFIKNLDRKNSCNKSINSETAKLLPNLKICKAYRNAECKIVGPDIGKIFFKDSDIGDKLLGRFVNCK